MMDYQGDGKDSAQKPASFLDSNRIANIANSQVTASSILGQEELQIVNQGLLSDRLLQARQPQKDEESTKAVADYSLLSPTKKPAMNSTAKKQSNLTKKQRTEQQQVRLNTEIKTIEHGEDN